MTLIMPNFYKMHQAYLQESIDQQYFSQVNVIEPLFQQ